MMGSVYFASDLYETCVCGQSYERGSGGSSPFDAVFWERLGTNTIIVKRFGEDLGCQDRALSAPAVQADFRDSVVDLLQYSLKHFLSHAFSLGR
jgi:hypothetical protein